VDVVDIMSVGARAAVVQAGLAVAWYAAVVVLFRFAGKRFAGQIVAFDLVVLITLGVVLQSALLRDGAANAVAFVVVVFFAHRLNGWACVRSHKFRRLVRGKARPLVEHGRVDDGALAEEGLSHEDLLAGLRKLGHDDPSAVRLAVLEETGQISVVAR
jgi:uncharacterized membrane protein YcaP (DUF421 family)